MRCGAASWSECYPYRVEQSEVFWTSSINLQTNGLDHCSWLESSKDRWCHLLGWFRQVFAVNEKTPSKLCLDFDVSFEVEFVCFVLAYAHVCVCVCMSVLVCGLSCLYVCVVLLYCFSVWLSLCVCQWNKPPRLPVCLRVRFLRATSIGHDSDKQCF